MKFGVVALVLPFLCSVACVPTGSENGSRKGSLSSVDSGDSATDTSVSDSGVDSGLDSGGTETGGDSAADSGTGSDSGRYTDFSGTLIYAETTDGAVVCDMRIDLAGASYAGDCQDCTFAFEMRAEVAYDGGGSGCVVDPELSWLGVSPRGGDPELFVFWDAYAGYSNVAATGMIYSANPLFPVFEFWAADGLYMDSSAIRTGNEVQWQIERRSSNPRVTLTNDCGGRTESTSTSSAVGTQLVSDDLVCNGSAIDLYQFDVSATGEVSISVDTVDAETTFDPIFWINGPDGCTTVYADDNFDCAYPPPSWSCPSWRGTLAPGRYELAVAASVSNGHCVDGPDGRYAVTIAGATARLSQDDAEGPVTTLAVRGFGAFD